LEPENYPGARALRGETVVPGIDFLHTDAAGRETNIRVSAAPFRDQAGKIAGLVTIQQDIDEQRRIEQAIRESD
jgi:signal transduction histidine kinase